MNVIHKLLFTIGIAFALSSCGALPEPSNYNQIWAETQTCTGLTTSKPEAVVIPDIFWNTTGDDRQGYYTVGIETIFIKESYQRVRWIVSHEMIHHLLYKNYGDAEANHKNILFDQCGIN